ncbi:hypothetical protein DSCW_40740 [Desulfosarcina widdelii]|uniref:DUF2784 domain-containing protein n=1 Tax=Desulfosarcina widdelii TaxID=947919 RepID=A0A5K7ZKW6_9BACT|nr:DUF2784 domain-containing protein [Desulfosarcina widdelii]BBO76657.1 hypothetical protein DSCW_40740 [Desulfosarcina widdelii]
MIAILAANFVVLVHLAFILFVVLGGFLALRWRKIALVHLPCVLWGVMIEWVGWLCPLTPLEYRLRRLAGEAGYSGGFVDHYIMPLVYPAGLTRNMQIGLGVFVLGMNLLVYGRVLMVQQQRKKRASNR